VLRREKAVREKKNGTDRIDVARGIDQTPDRLIKANESSRRQAEPEQHRFCLVAFWGG
jgi:hypothetical protein